jgi:hypothetical protein
MTEEEFVAIALPICLGGLMLYMVYIMYKLASESKAGKFGTVMIFVGLGLGLLGFIAKEVLIQVLE